MRGVAVVVATVVALCAAVAYGDEHFDYPFRLVGARSYLEDKAGLGHFRVQVQVPPEPKEQSDQTIVFFTGALGSTSSISYAFTNSGLALIWNAKHRWIASAGTVGCQPPGTFCDFVSLHGADLKVEPGDLVMLNVTNIPKKYVVGYEVSVPYKGLTTGVRTDFMLNQLYILGVFTEINAINVTRREQFPAGETRMLKIGYSTAVNEAKEIPLTWDISRPSQWDQKFVQQGDWLSLNWQ